MSRAVVDPDHLRQFAASLHRFSNDLRQQASALASQMSQLEQTWRDEQQRKFADEFEDSMRQIQRFILASEKHVPYLMRKAEQVDAYLGR
jgi:WXG100 family type VII secretion target